MNLQFWLNITTLENVMKMTKPLTSIEAVRLRFFANYADIGGDDSAAEKYRRYKAFCAQSGMPEITRNRFMKIANQLDTDFDFIHIPTDTSQVTDFYRACLTLDADSAISKEDVYQLYVEWRGSEPKYTRQEFFARFHRGLKISHLYNHVKSIQYYKGSRTRHFKGLAAK